MSGQRRRGAFLNGCQILAAIIAVGFLSSILSRPTWAQPAPDESAQTERQATSVSLGSLLHEMVDREAIARFPDPHFTCRQFSSYDRQSTTPDDPRTWFANSDANQFLREDEPDGRHEWVMMDCDGPGAIARLWSANPTGTIRIYLDNNPTPVIETPMSDLLGGKWVIGSDPTMQVGAPFAAVRSRGWNLYLPIPYAMHCKVTSDKPGFYYQINYRTYDKGTMVDSFSVDQLQQNWKMVKEVGKRLMHPVIEHPSGDPVHVSGSIAPGQSLTLMLPAGENAVTALTCDVDVSHLKDSQSALRSLVMVGTFDHEQTIWCPLSDFFGSGLGLNEYEDWYNTVHADGQNLQARWIMPYQRSAMLRVQNLGGEDVALNLTVNVSAWHWDERSMHFNARWREQNPLHTRPMQDWNYILARGGGVYVGDALAVTNSVKGWWGEGDEKIYVDGETFPSHFGTGTEDYYGYAWSSNQPFTDPFHAQPRCDGPGNYGQTTVTRVRLLDGIPYRKSLRFDMEVWHWFECDEGYAATTYLYTLPGATTNRYPEPDQAARGAINPPPLPPPFTIKGAIECEKMKVLASTPGMNVGKQAMEGFGENTWSSNAQLWVQANQVGDYIEVALPAPSDQPQRITLYATKSWDYGIVRFTINGKAAAGGRDIDFYSGKKDLCEASGPIDLGVFTPIDGQLILRAEVVGANPQAAGTRSFFGLDCVALQPAH